MIFIAHSSKDAILALHVVRYLELHGIQCCIAPRNIKPGAEFENELMQAIRDCDGVVLIASANSNSSKHVINEIRSAFNNDKVIYPFMLEDIGFTDKYEYYLSSIHRINAYTSFDVGLESLVKAIGRANHPEQIKQPSVPPADRSEPARKKEGGEIRIATYQDLVDTGLTALDIAERLVANDYKLYPQMVVENEGTPEQWAEYLSDYPETFRYLVTDKNAIIGNWSLLAVSEELHAEKLAKGELQEATFSADETEFLLFPGDYIGYLLNLSVNEGYNNAKNIRLLLHSFGEQLVCFAEQGIFFKEWYVNVFRKDHEAMYRGMGFRFLMNNISFGKLFKLECNPFPPKTIFSNSKKLMELYNEHFA